jgi:3-dehydroquinate dehydratase II
LKVLKFIVINGPNINLLGNRENEIYGDMDYKDICEYIVDEGKKLHIDIHIFQSNIEGEIVSAIQEADKIYDGIIINPAAYTHYSIAILDALRAVDIKAVEVHISNINKREEFRKHSVTAEGCIGQISGFGIYGYILAIQALKTRLNKK